MKKIILCNNLFMKRSLKKLSFILLLILMIILCYALKSKITKEGTSLRAGIYLEDPNGKALEIANTLVEKYDSVDFYICETYDELKNKVATTEYECGYVFPKDFNERLYNNDLNEIVDVYFSPATFLTTMTNEYVFSEIFEEYAFNRLIKYFDEKEIFDIEDIDALKDELRPTYDGYINSDDTFSFEYVDNDNKTVDNDNIMSSYVLLSDRKSVV